MGVILTALFVAVVGAVVDATAAHADESRPLQPVPQTGGPGRLALSSSAQPLLIPSLAPGSSWSWQVGATLDGESSGRLDLGAVASGSRAAGADGYHLTALGCRQPWRQADGIDTVPACDDPSGPSPVLARTPLSAVADRPGAAIGELTPTTPWYVSLTLDLPVETTQRLDSGDLAIGVRFTATGDDGSDLRGSPGVGTGQVGGGGFGDNGAGGVDTANPGPGGTAASPRGDGVLSWTGAPLTMLTVAGVIAVTGGLLLAGIARLRRRAGHAPTNPGPGDGAPR